MTLRRQPALLAVLCHLLLATSPASAQWLTQSFDLRPGWNAIFTHVDSSHETLDNLAGPGAPIASPIQEVWMWIPSVSTAQFVQSPQLPVDAGGQWVSWKRTNSIGSTLQKLVGNIACLVYNSSATNFSWQVKGKPLVPNHVWTSSGLNLVGFPTRATNPPSFESFLAQIPALQQNAEIYAYVGGILDTNNPAKLFAFRTTPVTRGNAYWIRAGNVYNRYYAPFEVRAVGPDGIQFSDNLGTARFRLRNLTAGDLTVTASHLASESAPAGQTAIAASPPLLIRGALNTTNLTHSHTNLTLGNSLAWNLKPAGQSGSEVEVVVGINRSAITNAPGSTLAGILRLSDSLGHAEINLPVTALAGSNAGLWVGAATVTHVGAYLKSFAKDATGAPIMSVNSNSFGSYITTSINTNLGVVPRPFPLRLIVHTDTTNTHLLQRVYMGAGLATNFVNATSESLLHPGRLTTARRITAIHLPFTATNQFWKFSGGLQPGTSATAMVTLPHDQHTSNPFLHTFHPDHDNLDARFNPTQLPRGFESYQVVRSVTLSLNPPADDFTSITRSGNRYSGVYSESVTVAGRQTSQGTESRTFISQGTFVLNRINNVATLTTP